MKTSINKVVADAVGQGCLVLDPDKRRAPELIFLTDDLVLLDPARAALKTFQNDEPA